MNSPIVDFALFLLMFSVVRVCAQHLIQTSFGLSVIPYYNSGLLKEATTETFGILIKVNRSEPSQKGRGRIWTKIEEFKPSENTTSTSSTISPGTEKSITDLSASTTQITDGNNNNKSTSVKKTRQNDYGDITYGFLDDDDDDDDDDDNDDDDDDDDDDDEEYYEDDDEKGQGHEEDVEEGGNANEDAVEETDDGDKNTEGNGYAVGQEHQEYENYPEEAHQTIVLRKKIKKKKRKHGKKHRPIKFKHFKKLKKFMLPLLIAYKLKFFALVPLLLGGLILIIFTTGFAGFFFALFAVGLGMKRH